MRPMAQAVERTDERIVASLPVGNSIATGVPTVRRRRAPVPRLPHCRHDGEGHQ